MAAEAKKDNSGKRIKISFQQAIGLILPYIKSRVMEQVRSVWLIILYLVLFQILVLGIPILDASIITFGLIMVIVGLTFFMEGLLLGLMPLGELIGIKLPQRAGLAVILAFSLVLGFGVTLAEPAIGALKILGSAVKAWDAPLLFLLLNSHANYLVFAVGAGVGMAVVFGMLRFLYNWSLKPFLYVMVPLLTLISIGASFDPNLLYLTGLAWDCGAVTTGPVTVPLVLALGIGITRIVGSSDTGGASGFGVVTLASLFPILTVMLLGIVFLKNVPQPMAETRFLSPDNRTTALTLFDSDQALLRYAFAHGGKEGITSYFDSDDARRAFVAEMSGDGSERSRIFGTDEPRFMSWVARNGTVEEKMTLFGSVKAAREYLNTPAKPVVLNAADLFLRDFQSAAQAIIPLTIFMLLVFFLILREKLPRADEIVFGIVIAVAGMGFFNIGMETGLSKIGDQVGGKLPSSFTTLPLEEQRETIRNFTPEVVEKAITVDGRVETFFYRKNGRAVEVIPYSEKNYDEMNATYTYVPQVGPLFGGERSFWGVFVALLFGFLMGYGATLAEPALNALGLKVEELTVGTFKKSFLMQAVAIGVGVGIAFGVAKIVWDIPLIWLLVPPYLLLMFLTKMSNEEYVNIGWDSAGVTTGPVTVPLVLAVGLGIGTRIGAVEGFGILAMASAYPILSVLLTGLYAARKRKQVVAGNDTDGSPETVEEVAS
ncbi:MAG TPA: DUF1538 domain-containing protein [bacterium]|nr:DUF1538 domain-containing protein [bacterium]